MCDKVDVYREGKWHMCEAKATHECPVCQHVVCEHHYKMDEYKCSFCTPPYYKKIK